MLTLTDRAVDALRRSTAAALRFDRDARIRLSRDGSMVRATFVHEGEAGDVVMVLDDGSEIFVAADLAGTIDAGDHDQLNVRP
jgi:hypothetical protein